MSIPAPAAPNLDVPFDVEGNIEPYLVAALKQAGICDLDPERSPQEQLTPRVEVQIFLGACIARTKLPTGCTDPRQALPTAWDVTFVLHVVTDRVAEAQRGAHNLFRAKVRRLAGQFFGVLNPRLPYHRLEKMVESGTVPGLVNDQARVEDISKLSFAGVVSVRDSAWPAGI